MVIPTRDRARLLARTLRAVAAQGPTVEIIVVDDGSRDGTSALLARSSLPGLRVIHHESSRGVAAARNAGVAAATAAWIGFCDDDDVWSPGKVRAQLDALRQSPDAAWCAVGAVWVDSDGNVLRGDRPPVSGDIADAVLQENLIPGGASGVVARTATVRRLGAFDTTFQTLADWDLWIRLALDGPVASVSLPLVAYQVHASNMSYDVRLRRRDLEALRAKHAATLAARGVVIDLARQRRYDATTSLRAGRRLRPAAHEAADALRRRQPRFLRRALVTLIAPEVAQRRHDRRKMSQMPEGWSDDLAAWLPGAWCT